MLINRNITVTWIEPLVFKKKFSWVEFSFGFLVIGGIYFVSSDFNPNEYKALGLGLFSALCAALFSVFNAKMVEKVPSTAITFHEMIMGFVVLTVVIGFQGNLNASLFQMTVSDFLWLLFLGICCTAFAFIATIEVMKKLGAFTVSLSINLEPVYTILLAIPILHEEEMLNGNFYAGSAMIIAVVVANAVFKSWQRKKTSRL